VPAKSRCAHAGVSNPSERTSPRSPAANPVIEIHLNSKRPAFDPAPGAVIPKAGITITGSVTGNLARTLVTNDVGLAGAPLLQPETYDVAVTAAGFEKLMRRGIVVRVGDVLTLRLTLTPGSTTTEVTVVGQTPLLEEKSITVGQVMEEVEILQLPLNGRNYLELGDLSPGAVVNAVTKSGTNRWHGSAYEFLRNDQMDAYNFFAKGSQPLFVFDPATTAPNPTGTGYVRTQFPGNLIPASRFDPIGKKIIDFYAPANQPGTGLANDYARNIPQLTDNKNLVVRGDMQLGAKDSMFVRGTVTRSSLDASATLPPPAQASTNRAAGRHHPRAARSLHPAWNTHRLD
jgi:hypothetical protein